MVGWMVLGKSSLRDVSQTVVNLFIAVLIYLKKSPDRPRSREAVRIEWEKNGVGLFIIIGNEDEFFCEICSLVQTYRSKLVERDEKEQWIEELIEFYNFYQKCANE